MPTDLPGTVAVTVALCRRLQLAGVEATDTVGVASRSAA